VTEIMKAVLPTGATEEFTDPTGTVTLAEVPLHELWFGRNASELEEATGARIAFVTRYGAAVLPTKTLVLQQDDSLHLLFSPGERARIEGIALFGEKGKS
jgi:trk system potassium uptake protein TrkA